MREERGEKTDSKALEPIKKCQNILQLIKNNSQGYACRFSTSRPEFKKMESYQICPQNSLYLICVYFFFYDC